MNLLKTVLTLCIREAPKHLSTFALCPDAPRYVEWTIPFTRWKNPLVYKELINMRSHEDNFLQKNLLLIFIIGTKDLRVANQNP